MKKPGKKFRLVSVVAFCLYGIAGCAQVTTVDSTPVDLDTLKKQLNGADRAENTRLDAARLLLRSGQEKALDILCDSLEDVANPVAQAAVARAIVAEDIEDESFVSPLVQMLRGTNLSVCEPAAEALAVFKGEKALAKLTDVASDKSVPVENRLVAIGAMGETLNRVLVGSLIKLVGDSDPVIRNAAAKSLERITRLRGFGKNKKKWEDWWKQYRDRPRLEWLEYAAGMLARRSISADEENSRLRKRLAEITRELYHASPTQQRTKILAEMLVDPVAEVRLLGIVLADNVMLESSDDLPKLKLSVRGMLDDDDSRVRKAAAILFASFGGKEAPARLTDRLRIESDPDVREGLFAALGRLKSASTIPSILEGIDTGDYSEASAASSALARILVDGGPVSEKIKEAVVAVLKKRMSKESGSESVELRESLLLAMGMLQDSSFREIMVEGLKDESAAIRRACITGLAGMDAVDVAPTISKLLDDADRGVRQAVIVALTNLDGKKFLKLLLRYTDPEVESDQAVRKQASDAVLAISKNLKSDDFPQVLEIVKKREKAHSLKIGILQCYIELLRKSGSSSLSGALYDLGGELLKAERPVEAAASLKEALDLVRREERPSPPAEGEIWQKYIDALLMAGDPGLGELLAKTESDEFVQVAVLRLKLHLGNAGKLLENPKVIPMMEAILEKAGKRISKEDTDYLAGKLKYIKKLQLKSDKEQVRKLLARIASHETSDDGKIAEQIVSMGKRAIRPLLEELKSAVSGQPTKPEMEKKIIELLRQIKSGLGEYPFNKNTAEKITTINSWLEKIPG